MDRSLPRLYANRLKRMSLRSQLMLSIGALIGLTVVLMLVPLYLSERNSITRDYQERLTALAAGLSQSIRAADVEALVRSGPRMSAPYVSVRTSLRYL